MPGEAIRPGRGSGLPSNERLESHVAVAVFAVSVIMNAVPSVVVAPSVPLNGPAVIVPVEGA